MVFAAKREKSSQSGRIHSVALRDEKAGVLEKCVAFFGVEYRQVCLIIDKEVA